MAHSQVECAIFAPYAPVPHPSRTFLLARVTPKAASPTAGGYLPRVSARA